MDSSLYFLGTLDMTNRKNIKDTLRLALPIIISQVGYMTMGIIDTIVAGMDSPATLAGVAAGSTIFNLFIIVGIGTLLGTETLVAQAFGRKDYIDCHRILGASLWAAAMISLIGTPALYGIASVYDKFGIHPEVIDEAQAYFLNIIPAYPTLIFFAAFNRYWQSMNVATMITWITVLANLANLFFDLILVHGWFGVEPMGATGIAIASLLTRTLALVAAIAGSLYIWQQKNWLGTTPKELLYLLITPSLHRIRRLFALGLPSSAQVALEMGAFSIATQIIATMDPETLGAHQIIMSISGFTFMFPLGLSSATATRVGMFVGQGDPIRARQTGWFAISFSVFMMFFFAVGFILLPEYLFSLFTKDSQILLIATSLAIYCAVFQIFDGLQVTATGALRGVGNTKGPVINNLISHYCMGLPIGLLAAFHFNLGIYGVWLGLSLGLIVVSILNLALWRTDQPSLTKPSLQLTTDN